MYIRFFGCAFKTLLVHATIILVIGQIYATKQFESNSTEFTIKNDSVETEKYSKIAKTMIINFLLDRNIKLQDIPQIMEFEFNSKKCILAKKLAALDSKKIPELQNKKGTELENILCGLFEEFAKHVKYVQIATRAHQFLNVIKDAKKQNPEETNCSYPNISTKQHLLSSINDFSRKADNVFT